MVKLEKIANAIQRIIDEFPYSSECVNCSRDSEFFDDSCNFIEMHYALRELKDAMKLIDDFQLIDQ